MKTIDSKSLHAWLSDKDRPDPLLIDVREPWEFAICHLEHSRNLEMRDLLAGGTDDFDEDEDIVLICHHGQRSDEAAMYLTANGFSSVYSLSKGLDDWAKQVDQTMTRY